MSELFFFGLFNVFSLALLVWTLKARRTIDHGVWRPSVTANENPAHYWREVLVMGVVVIIGGYFTINAIHRV